MGLKYIYLVRHAKSSWDSPNLADFDRPLNKRGKRDAPFMGDILKAKKIVPSVMISSTAKRAITTAKIIAKKIGYADKSIKRSVDAYSFEDIDWLRLLRKQSDSMESIMLFGHNPAMTDLANLLTKGAFVDNIPTCGIYAIQFEIDSWKTLDRKMGELLFFEYPKKHQQL